MKKDYKTVKILYPPDAFALLTARVALARGWGVGHTESTKGLASYFRELEEKAGGMLEARRTLIRNAATPLKQTLAALGSLEQRERDELIGYLFGK